LFFSKERNREVQPIPPPPPKSKLTVEKLREKLYPSLRPKRPRTTSEELEEQPVATDLTPVATVRTPIATDRTPVVIDRPPVVIDKIPSPEVKETVAIKEVPPVIHKQPEDGMEFISEFPLDQKAREATTEEKPSKKELPKETKKNDPEVHVRVDIIPERFPNAQIVTVDKSMVASIMSKKPPTKKAAKLGMTSPISRIKPSTPPARKPVIPTVQQATPTVVTPTVEEKIAPPTEATTVTNPASCTGSPSR